MPSYPFIEVKQSRGTFLLSAIPASALSKVSYAAIRHQDQEEGAVQRVLNQSRIAGVKSFTLSGGDFPASIVLNWIGDGLHRNNGHVEFELKERSAQIIDGQHRVAGIGEAIAERPEIASTLIPVAIYENLNTTQCANIFLSINTEQRPVPRSLVFDLYGIASEELTDRAASRARDITLSLNEPDQAYAGLIKLPNARRQKGGIALSTAVSSIKPLVAEKGVLDQIGATSLEIQTQIFQNLFNAIADKYGDYWGERDNAFLYAAGFMGAVEFLHLRLIPYCVRKKSFKQEVIAAALRLDRTDLIKQGEVKGLGGRDAPRKVYERLDEFFVPAEEASVAFEV